MNFSDWTKEEEGLWLGALKESVIEKWVPIVEGTGVDDQGDNCPLCLLADRINHESCSRCPVCIDTGKEGCQGTPYNEWGDYWNEVGRSYNPFIEYGQATYKVATQQEQELAQAELDYLKDLYLQLTGEKL